jgi:hypothetical protein
MEILSDIQVIVKDKFIINHLPVYGKGDDSEKQADHYIQTHIENSLRMCIFTLHDKLE